MSQHINHRRGSRRHQDNGPRWENANPMSGCNSTHVARARRSWQDLRRRSDRRISAQTDQSGEGVCRMGGESECPRPEFEVTVVDTSEILATNVMIEISPSDEDGQ